METRLVNAQREIGHEDFATQSVIIHDSFRVLRFRSEVGHLLTIDQVVFEITKVKDGIRLVFVVVVGGLFGFGNDVVSVTQRKTQ